MNITSVKKIIFISLSTIVVFVVILSLIFTFYFGKIAVSLKSDGLKYSLDDDSTIYIKSTTFLWIKPGKHQVTATELNLENPYSKTYILDVKPGKTAPLNVFFLDSNNNASQTLIEQLPITKDFGTVVFDNYEERYYVYLDDGKTKEAALKWLRNQGLEIDGGDIIWEAPVSD